MITLDLTKEETFMLRDLTIGMDCGYAWMQEIADSLEEKLGEAIKKPQMKRSEFNQQISDTKTRWENKGLATSMMLAKEAELKFYYDMERIGWGRIEKAFSEARVNVERGPDKKKAV